MTLEEIAKKEIARIQRVLSDYCCTRTIFNDWDYLKERLAEQYSIIKFRIKCLF
jgi:hypothetical protein